MRMAVMAALLFLAAMAPHEGAAQTAEPCRDCRSAASCRDQGSSCDMGCRARHFASDPRRDACSDTCAETAARCEREAALRCRAPGACR